MEFQLRMIFFSLASGYDVGGRAASSRGKLSSEQADNVLQQLNPVDSRCPAFNRIH